MRHLAVIAVMAYVRKGYLENRIQEFELHTPSLPIVIGIDKYEGNNEKFRKQNELILEYCNKLKMNGQIVDFYFNKENIGTKQNWHKLIKFGHRVSDNVIYIEDDIQLLRPFAEIFEKNYLVSKLSEGKAIICLQSNYPHTTKSVVNLNDQFLSSKWLNGWGVIISKSAYINLYESKELNIYQAIYNFLDNAYFKSLFKQSFKKTWYYKFRNALNSRTAWDTELMFRMWQTKTLALMPINPFTKDLGVDESSISTLKNHEKDFPEHTFLPRSATSLFCLNCEKKRYWRDLHNHRKMNFLIVKKFYAIIAEIITPIKRNLDEINIKRTDLYNK